ncbi:TrmH family RNA methyltransferase [Balamuthia mandrillaris]
MEGRNGGEAGGPEHISRSEPSSQPPKQQEEEGEIVFDKAENKELAAFRSSTKNKIVCLQNLVSQVQAIEREWDSFSPPQQRERRIRLLVACLATLKGHKDKDLREVSRLSDKVPPHADVSQFTLKHFLGLFLPIERKHTRGLRDDEFLITRDDHRETGGEAAANYSKQSIPLTLVLDNIRSAFNVGSIFRTAECLGVQKIYLCGYTATPEEGKATQRTTMNAHHHVRWEWRQHVKEVVQELKRGEEGGDAAGGKGGRGMPIIALETVKDQPTIFDFSFPPPFVKKLKEEGEEEEEEKGEQKASKKIKKNGVKRKRENADQEEDQEERKEPEHMEEEEEEVGCALILGNERHGIESDLLAMCDAVVSIPCRGVKNSLNVGVAFGICGYEILRQWQLSSPKISQAQKNIT